MKIILILALTTILLTTTSYAHIVRIGLKIESGSPAYTINNVACPREHVTRALTKISDIDKDGQIALDLDPSANAQMIMDIVKELKLLGLTNAVMVYREVIPLDGMPTTSVIAVPLNLELPIN